MDIEREIAALQQMSVGQLQARFADVFGAPPRSRHRIWLIRRIAWRLQANKYGGLSERALARARELANVADLRLTPPKGSPLHISQPAAATQSATIDPRLPRSGTLLARAYKGRTIVVQILDDGFEFDGRRFPSLSSVAKAVTGAHWNGFHFFGLRKGAS